LALTIITFPYRIDRWDDGNSVPSISLTSDCSTLASISAELLAAQFPMRKGVRLLGVSLSSLCADAADVDTQMTLAL
jgi:hypothetical protein